MIFTTSWDDGYASDLRVGALLKRYGMTGTFYVSPTAQHGQRMLTEREIRTMSEEFEIGAHTLRHPRLTALPQGEARKEIIGSKQWVEGVTGKPCTMFCYPKGDENATVKAMVREAGFLGARTIVSLRFDAGEPFAMPTTLQIYPFPWRRTWTRWWHPLDPLGRLRVQWKRLRELGIPFLSYRGWLPLATALFEHAITTAQPIFHLWGHSAELDRFGLWDDLDRFLAHVARRGVSCRTNSDVLRASTTGPT